VVPITDDQYRQAVDLLAAMIVSWVQSPGRRAPVAEQAVDDEELVPERPATGSMANITRDGQA
jgi:hypothetical protein